MIPEEQGDVQKTELHTLEIKIARSENLPVLPQIASAVLKLADDPSASAKAMERLIERDPAITAKILRVANSPYYGLNQVVSVGRAISILGLSTIKSLVIGVAYQQVLANKTQCVYFDKFEFWRHSLAVATAARILGKLKIPMKAEELYSAGMMHDVGILVLDRFCTEELNIALKSACQDRCPLHRVEQDVLGYTHADVGGVLAKRWGLTPLMTAMIANHHTLDPEDEHYACTCFISAADTLAHQCGYTNNVPDVEVEFSPGVEEAIGVSEQQLAVIRDVIKSEVGKAEEAFQVK